MCASRRGGDVLILSPLFYTSRAILGRTVKATKTRSEDKTKSEKALC